jgi:membrane fusion protein (multidrug efflux system)
MKAIGAALAGALLLMSAACSRNTEAAGPAGDQVRAVAVRAVAAEQKNIAEELSLTGTLKPRAQVQVVSEISARMLRLLKDEGVYVAKGDVIAALDSTDARLALDRASATVAMAAANREHAVAERDRANHLLQTGGITDKDHLAAQVNLQVAEASLRQARVEEAIAAQQLARCQIRAPFSGRVAKRLVDPGTMLAPGTAVVTLVDNAVLEFRAAVPSADLEKARIGAAARVSVDALPGFAAGGRITRILPLVDERSRSFEVVVEVAGRPELVSGLFARARVKVRDIGNAVVVPPSALVRDGGQPDAARLFVVENGKAEMREVKVGVEGLDAVQIRQGLNPGAMVVVDPPTTLASGARVEISRGDR